MEEKKKKSNYTLNLKHVDTLSKVFLLALLKNVCFEWYKKMFSLFLNFGSVFTRTKPKIKNRFLPKPNQTV